MIALLASVVVLGMAAQTPLPAPPTFLNVVVNDENGARVAGAEVFENGVSRGFTDATGAVSWTTTAPYGTTLFARRLVFTQPSYRPNSPAGDFVMRVYQTSRAVNNDGSAPDYTITRMTRTHTLTVRRANTLIGWHLVASLDWDASVAEMNALSARFALASQYLYDLTDGQFFIERVDIADDGQMNARAEIAFKVDNFVWPHTTYPGGFLFAVGGLPHVYMAPFGVAPGTTSAATLIHELGHLAFGLADEYVGPQVNPGCTAARKFGPATPEFAANGAKAACAMDDESRSKKLCSGHADSAHRGGNWQPGPCWHTVAAAYGDPGPGGSFGTGAIWTDRWILRTPDSRGAVVGTLPLLMSGLQPLIVPANNPAAQTLCAPVTVTDPNGAAAANGAIWVRPFSGWRSGDYSVGRLDASGSLVVRGLHAGDVVMSPWSFLPFACTPTI